MDKEILWQLLIAITAAAVPVLTGFLCDLIRKGAKWLIENTKMAKYEAIIDEVTNAVTNAVTYVNQTYVDALKEQNAFGGEETELAFAKAYQATIETLSQDAVDFLTKTYGDISSYLEVAIETTVRQEKKWS